MTSKKNKLAKVALIGSYPPPYGGVTIHIQRLKKKLDETEIDSVVYDLIGKNGLSNKNVIVVRNHKRWILKYIFSAREKIIHSHVSDWRLRMAIGLMSIFGKKTVISIHGESLNNSLKSGNWFRKQIIKFALKHSSFVIVMNSNIERLCLSMGINQKRIRIIPSFIPPTIQDKDILKIPQDVWNFIETHKPIISANAFKIKFYENEDLYGIDMCIELCAKLKKIYPKIGLVVSLGSIGNHNYFKELKKKIREKGIENNFLFITEPYPFYPILMKSDLFVRPTVTDGDAISIREALYFKIPTVASDVVPRPKGTVLFINRDIHDLKSKVKYVFDNYTQQRNKLKAIKIEDNFENIMKLYQKLLNN